MDIQSGGMAYTGSEKCAVALTSVTLIGSVAAVGAAFFGYQSGTVFTPTLMIKELGTPPAMVRNVTRVFALFMASGMLLAGWFSDRHGRKPAAIIQT